MHRSLQYVGLSLVIIGAVLLIVPTASFSTIAGDRSVDVSIADDSEAFVAVAETDTEITQPGDGDTAAELVNNLGEPMTVEYEASVTASGLSVTEPSETVTIDRGRRRRSTWRARPPRAVVEPPPCRST